MVGMFQDSHIDSRVQVVERKGLPGCALVHFMKLRSVAEFNLVRIDRGLGQTEEYRQDSLQWLCSMSPHVTAKRIRR